MWLSNAELRGKFHIQSNAFESELSAASADAALIIQRGTDAAIYTEAVGETVPTDPTELLRYNSVVTAHSYLSMWFLVGNAGNKLQDYGFVKQSQDAGSPATTTEVTNQFLTPKDLADLKSEYLNKAQFYIGDYGEIVVEIDEVTEAEQSFAMSSLQWF